MARSGRGMIAGVAAVTMGFGVTQLIAPMFDGSADARTVVNAVAVELVPGGVRHWAIESLNVREKLFLSLAVLIAVAVLAALAGSYEAVGRPVGSTLIFVAGAAGCVAVLLQPGSDAADILPILVGTSSAVAALRWLTRTVGSAPHSTEVPDTARRQSFATLGVLGVAVATGAGGVSSYLSAPKLSSSRRVGDLEKHDLAVNVKDHGAVGDGTTGDSAAIQAALDAIPDSGGTLLFPRGIYNVDATITCCKPVRFQGIGSSASTLRLGAKTDLLALSAVSNVVVQDLHFDGNVDVIGAGHGALLNVTEVSNLRISGCRFGNGPSSALSLTRVNLLWITENHFENIYHAGIRFQDPTAGHFNEYVWVDSNYFDTCQAGRMDGNAAIQAQGTGTISHRHLQLIDNIIRNPRIVGIGLDSVDQSRVAGNVITKDASCSNGETIAFTGSGNVVSENYCRNMSTSSAAGILYWAVSSRTNDNNVIVNNRLTNAGQGVGFTWGEDGAAISNLFIEGNQCYGNNIGIQSWATPGVAAGSQDTIVIANNILRGNQTDALSIIQNGVSGIAGNPTVFGQHLSGNDTLQAGNVGLELDGAWDRGHLLLGRYHIWVDAQGNLRIHPSAPSSDVDGVVVGTQN